jgi:hypothetical protein
MTSSSWPGAQSLASGTSTVRERCRVVGVGNSRRLTLRAVSAT